LGCQAAHTDKAGVDPGTFGQCRQIAGTGGEDVITSDCQAHHGGINRRRPPLASSIPARLPSAVMTAATRIAGRPPRPPPALTRDRDQADWRLHEPT
jgi:hypothetical protein